MKKITRIYKKFTFLLKNKIDIDNQNINVSSLEEIFTFYGTDKATSVKNQYDVNSNLIIGHGYSKFYEEHFSSFRKLKFNLLEIGTWLGASSAAFTKYFNEANIFGIDRNFKFKYKSKRIKFYNCDLTDVNDLRKLEKKINEKQFKIIIDDGSHILSHIIKNLLFFFKYLEKGGYFVVEDFNAPRNYDYLNDSNNQELFFDEILFNIKSKNYFKSKILTRSDQKFLFENIESINIYKGKHQESDIAFLKKR